MSRSNHHMNAVCAGTLACAMLTGLAVPAHADDWDALWPETAVESAHLQGLDGSGIRVAVIDTLSVDHPGLQDADITHEVGPFDDLDGNMAVCAIDGRELPSVVEPGDRIGISGDDVDAGWYYTHATGMLLWLAGNGMDYEGQPGIKGIAPKASILHLADGVEIPGTTTMAPCDGPLGETGIDSGGLVQQAVDWGARIINRSQGASTFDGYDVDPDDIEAYVDALRHGNVSILSPGYGVMGDIGQLSPGLTSKNGGTSTAAVILTGYLTLAMQKWPDATGNQIIQSLIRNTKQNDNSPDIDPEHKRGFGEVDVNKLLTVDPTQYPDINPILEYEVLAAAQYDETKNWYTRDCATDPDPDSMGPDEISCKAGLIGDEYERQKTAWEKVKQCQADGGTDCMKYSATYTADQTDATGESESSNQGEQGLPCGRGWQSAAESSSSSRALSSPSSHCLGATGRTVRRHRLWRAIPRNRTRRIRTNSIRPGRAHTRSSPPRNIRRHGGRTRIRTGRGARIRGAADGIA